MLLSPVPGSPARREGSRSRPVTPSSPRKGGGGSSSRATSPNPFLEPASEMDVSNVDPESVLVDFETVDAGDVSVEMMEDDVAWLKTQQMDHGKEDKVMVSIRVRPSNEQSAWVPSPTDKSIKLEQHFAKASSSSNPSSPYHFDAILTGTPNKPIYTTVARSHVYAAMEGFNSVIFAYGQTASGKTFTLSGNEDEPGIIPRAMKDVFGFIKKTQGREYLLRCSYLEIYNESIHDLLAPPSMAAANPVQIQGGAGGTEVILTPLREEVVTSLKGVKEVLKRGEGNRRTACTDWNDRSSRSHSVFRLVIESRERGGDRSMNEDEDGDDVPLSAGGGGRTTPAMNGRHTPGLGGRQTPGLSGRQTPGPRLQARGGRSVQTSVLSLIDLAGSEKATSDKERTREGKYINTSLLTLGTVIGTLADNASKKKTDHVPFRNSKLTRMLQPSLSGNARISVICTINPDPNAIAESTSTLLFAKRIKSVKLNAQKKEVMDTDALIERYRKEIEDLKRRLEEREVEAPVRNRRLSAREQLDESKAVKDLSGRIQQLTKLILTSQSVEDVKEGDGESRPSSPQKINFDMSPYELQQELLAARTQIDSQANQLLSLEAALLSRPPLPPDAPDSAKEKMIADQAKTIRELEIVVRGYEENLGEPLRKVREDVEAEWMAKVEEERKKREEKERWAEEVVKELEKEKKARKKLEVERQALAAFVSKFDSLGGLGLANSLTAGASLVSKLNPPKPVAGGAAAVFGELQQAKSGQGEGKEGKGHTRVTSLASSSFASHILSSRRPDLNGDNADVNASPVRLDTLLKSHSQPSLLDQALPSHEEMGDMSFDELEVANQLLELEVGSESGQQPRQVLDVMKEQETGGGDDPLAALEAEHQALAKSVAELPVPSLNTANRWKMGVGMRRDVFGGKENVGP
ncbi:kinesin [Coprinopsis sp. MPI-PUGE-AT-0042]|nr:kinesin [Coprinopsis sp. MPI-PUGE-AT-0042]